MLLPRSPFDFCKPALRLGLSGACIVGFAVCSSGLWAQQQAQGPGRSPFLPPDWDQGKRTEERPQVPAQGAEQSAYAFNGLLTLGGRTYFSVSNEQTKQAYLLELNEDSQGVQVTSYDPARNTVSISQPGGSTQELALRKSDGEPVVAANQGRNIPGQPRIRNAGAGAQGGGSQVAADRRGPPVEWMEARYRRLGEQIEMRRLADTQAAGAGAGAAGGGSSTVQVGTGGGAQAGSNSSMSAGSGGRSGGDQGQNVRRRRLRLDTPQQ